MDDHEGLDLALERCIAGDASDADRATVAAWVDAKPERRNWLEAFTRRSAASSHGWRTSLRHHELREAIRAARTTRFGRPSFGFRSWPVGGAIAATLLLFIVAYQFLPAPELPAPVFEASTSTGERRLLVLEHDTRVVLGPNSRIRVARGGRRAVVEGLAYIEVRHITGLPPFRVRAGHIVATDLGTAFAIQSYPADTLVQVLVTEGAVSIRAMTRSTPAQLREGELALAGHGGFTVSTPADLAPLLAWTSRPLRFVNAPLGEVLDSLSRRFEVRFVIAADVLPSTRVTAVHPYPNLSEMVQSLEEVHPLRFERQGNQVHVRRSP